MLGRRLPFVEAIGGNQATQTLERRPDGRLFCDRLTPGIVEFGADTRIFGPGGDEPPAVRDVDAPPSAQADHETLGG